MGLSIWHILLMMIVIILVFGTSKLKNLGKDLGGAIKDFRSSVNEESGTTSSNQKITDQDQENNKV
ncbi:Sec-independent protein translocase subunit TatA [Acinetobacter sp. C32I]|uniref:Sec-independent protein translocase subunit TatA n=1 Tax=Acinetobacter sp. C32I TaxID=2950074 RepID=UPI002036879C|nr:Sec-independent protein translocase subunit TatA [Acinetobacter sp. C32I]USA55362.1 Sec-independent protein translocase subunit TatA [Acinetobacter sp. C32I]